MLEDVLATLAQVDALEVLVIGSDESARLIADAFDVKTLPERGLGAAAVVQAATRIMVE